MITNDLDVKSRWSKGKEAVGLNYRLKQNGTFERWGEKHTQISGGKAFLIKRGGGGTFG